MAKKPDTKKQDSAKKLKVTLLKSIHGQLAMHRNNVRGLGLTRPHQSVEVAATPAILGMVHKSAHMFRVEEVA
jgi:large subunit ribosomal protein L30